MLDIAIVLNGEIADKDAFKELVNNATYVVAVDGGLNHLVELDIKPDMFLGDFDSVKEKSLQQAKQWEIITKEFPAKKNNTDSELALSTVFSNGFIFNQIGAKPVIGFLAAFGKRYDHLLSNQLLAKKFAYKADFILSDGLALQWIVKGPKKMKLNWPLSVQEEKGDFCFSLLALSDIVENITLKYSEYPLINYNLKSGETLGVSNLVKKEQSDLRETQDVEVSFSKGCVSIIIIPDK